MQLHEIEGPAGKLEARIDEPALRGIGADGRWNPGAGVTPTNGKRLRAAVVLGHPHTEYGGTMHTKVLYQAAKALSRIGCETLRFNFRGAGTSAGHFTNGPGEMEDFRAALDFMRARHPGAPLWAGGMSFGGWVGLSVGAEDRRVSALLGISLPVATYDFENVARSTTAKFFIQGERDELCSMDVMREFYARAAEPKELVIIDGADHLFDGRVGEVADAIEDLLGDL
ncbi:MAG TPA: alpha/beta fold hydrolase [Vicinamibacterales bacterium]|jgi:alpha/beta superfamily hydrolase|nr:alpha/beta fold hydrolase [Vicinamibacterales bacterium]